jgi:hypothetical protein
MSDLEYFLEDMYADEQAKLAEQEFSNLSLGELEEIIKHAAEEQATSPGAGNAQYVGSPNSEQTGWPRSALGVDAAGRNATPGEAKQQQSIYPQSDQPKTAGALLLDAVSGKVASLIRMPRPRGMRVGTPVRGKGTALKRPSVPPKASLPAPGDSPAVRSLRRQAQLQNAVRR